MRDGWHKALPVRERSSATQIIMLYDERKRPCKDRKGFVAIGFILTSVLQKIEK